MSSLLRSIAAGLGLTLVALGAAVDVGCGNTPPQDVSVARLAITTVPADVNCLRITAVGARTVIQQFDVTPGTSSSMLVTGLPTGDVVFTADAFAATCATAGDRTTANWVSDPVTLSVSTSEIVDLSVVLRRNGRIRVGVDFQDDVTATCTDGIQNGGETGVDCGGPTCGKCVIGTRCRVDADCQPGSTCVMLVCRVNQSTCADGIQNGDETGVDCGGAICNKCVIGTRCRVDADCQPGSSCAMGTCRMNPPTCTDGIQNGDETNIDCGGATCPVCGSGKHCRNDADCPLGESCDGILCRPNPPTCADGIQNGDETNIDCGGATCPMCASGMRCRDNKECAPGESCNAGFCGPNLACVLPDGAVGWWRGENNYLDSIGMHHGTPVGNVSFVPGIDGTAFGFDGVTSAYVDADDAPDLDVTTGFTIDAWINRGGETGRIVDKIHAFQDDGYLFDLVSGRLRISAGFAALVTADPLPANTFLHVAAVFDGIRLALFVNGVLVAETPAVGHVPVNMLPVRIGADSGGGSPFPGIIDEPRIFNRGLTDAEVRGLFQRLKACF